MPHLVKQSPSIPPALNNPTTTTTTTTKTTQAMATSLEDNTPSSFSMLSRTSPLSSDFSDDGSEDSSYSDNQDHHHSRDITPQSLTLANLEIRKQRERKKIMGPDLFSRLPNSILQTILGMLPAFQMLTISELSRKFYKFVVLEQEMNEVWFRLVQQERAEEKKRMEWFRQKKLEQEQRSVQMMMRSFSGSSTSSGYGGGGEESPISKQAQRLLNKKKESATGAGTGAVAKVMKRSDRKKNWCQIYVDAILRGNGESPLQALSEVVAGSAKRPTQFQTVVLNETLAPEHLREFQGRLEEDKKSKELTREEKSQAKIDKRMYYKSIRSKPKGKKAGQLDSGAARVDSVPEWRQPEWSQQDSMDNF